MLSLFFLSLISVSTPPKALESLREHFKSSKGFEVEFTQEIKQDIFPEDHQPATGHVKFIRPQHLIWLYQTPRKRAIEYDGRELKIEENSKVEVIRDSGQITLQESFSFLWGQPNPQVFSVEAKGDQSFRVTPRSSAKAGFKFIDVRVSKGLVEEAKVTDHLGGESLLKFQGWNLLR